jgi:hypothetical protein
MILVWFSFTAFQDPQLINKFLRTQNLNYHFEFQTKNRVAPRQDPVMSLRTESGAWVRCTMGRTISAARVRFSTTENCSKDSSTNFCTLSEHTITGTGHISFKITPYLGGHTFISTSCCFYFPVIYFWLWQQKAQFCCTGYCPVIKIRLI